MEEFKPNIETVALLSSFDTREYSRLNQIREIMQLGQLITDKSKLYEIKRILNESMIDYVEVGKQTNPKYYQDFPIQKLLFPEVS
ncbi:MAG: hypothetical protein JWO09_129 [Bacteroidetes bacterium]|nr:hypothetical protein [Bacteroidota bacterium]